MNVILVVTSISIEALMVRRMSLETQARPDTFVDVPFAHPPTC